MASASYTDEMFILSVKESTSIRECLKKIGLNHTGGNYKTFYSKVKELNIDTSHFTGQSHMTGKHNTWGKKRKLEDILQNGIEYKSHELRIRLIKEGVKEDRCEICGNSEWMGRHIPLELDHKNGIHNDNRLENLQIICPNCHAQTTTYCGKNIKKKKMSIEQRKVNESKRRKKFTCSKCGDPCTKTKHGICKKCRYENMTLKFNVSKDQLLEDVKSMSMLAIGRKYGVSDNAIRKRCKKLNILNGGVA